MKPAFCTFGYCSQYSTGCSPGYAAEWLEQLGMAQWRPMLGRIIDLSHQKDIANYLVELSEAALTWTTEKLFTLELPTEHVL